MMSSGEICRSRVPFFRDECFFPTQGYDGESLSESGVSFLDRRVPLEVL